MPVDIGCNIWSSFLEYMIYDAKQPPDHSSLGYIGVFFFPENVQSFFSLDIIIESLLQLLLIPI